jgi:Phage tail tube protein
MATTRRQILMVKKETTYGTSASAAGTDALLVLNPQLTPLDGDLLEREIIDSSFGRTRSRIIAMRKMGLQFDVEAAGSGTAGTAPKYDPLLLACGFNATIVSATSVTYAPISTTPDSCELYHNWDGNKHQGLGARGTFDLSFEAGQIPKFSFNMQGIYQAVTDTAFPSPTYTNQAAPVAFDSTNTATVTVASLSACVSAFSLSLGNQVQFFDHAGCTKQVRITDRNVEGSITIERPDALSTKDFYALAIAGTTGGISFTHGTVAGNRLAVSLPTVNFGPPKPADIRGIAGLEIPFVALHTAGSSDELSLAFT